jgi:hypothetical protein
VHFGPGHGADVFRAIYFFTIGLKSVGAYDSTVQFTRWWFAEVFGTSASLARILIDVGQETVRPNLSFQWWTQGAEVAGARACKAKKEMMKREVTVLRKATKGLASAIEQARGGKAQQP